MALEPTTQRDASIQAIQTNPPSPEVTGPTSGTTEQQSALVEIRTALAAYGLSGLAEWAWDRLLNGASEAQIFLEMRDRPEYAARFPGMADLRKQGSAITESEYIKQEESYKEVMHAYGLPSGFYDSPDDFGRMIAGHVSSIELRDRVQVYSQAVLGDSETLNQLKTLYADAGIPRSAESDLLAYYLDPNRAAPILQQQYDAAQFSAAAAKSGFGQLSKAQAETYGARAGVDERTARVGFEELQRGKELFQGLPGQGEQAIGQDVQLGAVAFGGNALDTNEIRKRREQRVAAGQGGGDFSRSRTGSAVGLTSNKV